MDKQKASLKSQITGLQAENDLLRDQLKELNLTLTRELERKKIPKAPAEKVDDIEKVSRLLEQSIENNDKQIKYYKLEIQCFSNKNEGVLPGERVDSLLETAKQKEAEINSISSKIRELQLQNKNLEKEELEIKNSTQFIKSLEQKTIEINNLQRKISSLKSRLQANEKNQKAQKEHLSKLENKLIENAQKLGGSVNLEELKNQLVSSNSKKIEVLHGYNETLKNLHFKNKLDSRVAIDEFVRLKTGPTIKKRYASVKEYKDEKEEAYKPVFQELEGKKLTKEEFQKFRATILKLAKILRKEVKAGQSKIEVLTNQTTAIDFSNKELENRIREREKEMNMANAQFEEFKKVNKSTIVLSPLPPASKTLEKLDKYESKVTEPSLAKSFISAPSLRRLKISSYSPPLSTEAIFFDDSIFVPPLPSLRKIDFYLSPNENILGFQGSYLGSDGQLIAGPRNIKIGLPPPSSSPPPPSTSSMKGSYLGLDGSLQEYAINIKSFALKEKDFIRNVVGMGGEGGITFLHIETNEGECFEIGDQEKEADPFELNIRNFDIPIILFGVIEPKKTSIGFEYILSGFGLAMKNELKMRSERNRELQGFSTVKSDEESKSKEKQHKELLAKYRFKLKKKADQSIQTQKEEIEMKEESERREGEGEGKEEGRRKEGGRKEEGGRREGRGKK